MGSSEYTREWLKNLIAEKEPARFDQDYKSAAVLAKSEG